MILGLPPDGKFAEKAGKIPNDIKRKIALRIWIAV